MKTSITIEVDTDLMRLESKTDEYIAALWAVSQINPAPLGDESAARLVTEVGHEIIRRWLSEPANRLPLYQHSSTEYFHRILMNEGKWVDGVWTHNSELPEELKS